MIVKFALREEKDRFTLDRVRLGRHTCDLTIRETTIGNVTFSFEAEGRGKGGEPSDLALVIEIDGKTGRVRFKRYRKGGRDEGFEVELLQADEQTGGLVYNARQPIKGTGRKPFEVEIGLEGLLT